MRIKMIIFGKAKDIFDFSFSEISFSSSFYKNELENETEYESKMARKCQPWTTLIYLAVKKEWIGEGVGAVVVIRGWVIKEKR